MGEVVGFWPNWKKSDNAFQAIGILIAIVVCALILMVWNPTGIWWLSALVGVLAGLISGALVTGFILMIRGLKGQVNSKQ
jgi:F0F1-type ATP synthase assembly protein I